jgi:hypothetical protein
MDEIKSAWEIAQEKIKDITVDKKAMAAQENSVVGKKIASRYLEDPERTPLADELKAFDGAKKAQALRGVVEVLLANLTLPLSESSKIRNERVMKVLPVLAPGAKQLPHILSQIRQFYEQYGAERERIEEALEAQYAPRLRQKAEALAKQMGARIELKAMQDPEFVALLKKNQAMFDERYTEAVQEVKKEIERLVLPSA